ncbi:SCA7, zinc-binding domain-containing protein [Mucor lusitanicus]|nr:SCA7, zinc-binding domain-containing protein [Mucor lusitanicus]
MASANGNLKKYGNTKVDLLSEEQQDVLRNKGSKIERLQSDITQLSKPLLQSEGSLNWSKHVTPATLSIFHDEKSWSGIHTIEPKKKTNVKEFKDSYGLSWHQMRDTMHLESETESVSEMGSPVTTRLDVKDMDIFGAMPLEEEFVVVKCKNCQRPILPSKFKEHSELCIGATFTDEDEEEEPDTRKKLIKNMKKKATALEDELNTPSTTAKRPPTVLAEKPDKKKMKKEKQKKTTKQKAPLDLDKQCGVIQGQNNLPCTRSLTCKSHSMGAKRAVEGRSQKYDVLLQAYQKKSIGRPNAPASSIATSNGINNNGAISGGKSIKNLKRLQGQQMPPSANGNNGSNSSGIKSNLASTQLNEEPFVDSDEEVENVMQALKLSRPTPLAQKPFFFVKRRRQCFRLRDVLLDSITPKSATANDSHIPTLPAVDNRYTNYARQQQQQQYQQQQYQQQQQQQQQQQMFNGMVIDNNTLYGENPNNINASFSVR